MRRFVFFLVCAAALIVPVAVLAAGGGGGGFDGVVSSIEHTYHVRATRIPFLGLISLVAHGATTGGVSGLHLAQFEDFKAPMDGEDLTRMVEEKLGSSWARVVRDTSRGGEQTLIFMRPEGSRMGLFILDADGHELDVVQVSVNPDRLNATIGQYSHHHDGDGDHDD